MANTVAIDVKINALEAASTLKDLRKNLKDAVSELAGLESGTAEFNRLANAVDDAKDRIEKLNADIEQVGAAGKFGALADMGSKIAAGFEVAQGAMALFGSESEEVEKALQKVQGAMALAQGAKELSEFGKSFNQLKTIAVNAFNGMSAASKAFALTGIGLLITAIGALAANWDTIKEKLGLVDEKQAALNATLEDYKKGAQGAIEKTTEVKNAFELAREGVISKEEALEKYNSTLGDTFGKATDLNEAERIYNQKTKAYVESTALRAQYQSLLQKATEAQVASMTASMEDQTGFFDKLYAATLSSVTGISKVGEEELKKRQEIRVKEVELQKKKSAEELSELAASKLKEAELLEKNNKIVSEDEKKSNDKKIANRIAANNKQADLQAELNRILAGLRNENLDDERQRAKDKENIDYNNLKKEYETKFKGQKQLAAVLEELRLKHLNSLSEIDNKFNIEDEKKDKEKQQKKINLTIEGINNERKALENQRELTIQEQITFENRVYEATISNTRLTLAEKEKLQLEHNGKLKELNDKQIAENKAGILRNIDEEILLQETRIKTLQRNKQITDDEERELARLQFEKIKQDTSKNYEELTAAREAFDAKMAEIDARDAERKRQAAEATLNITKGALQATADLVGAFAGKSKEAQKRAFETQKAINIASAVIDTYQSAVAAYKGSIGVPIVGPVLAPIAAATAIAAGIANIRKIEQTKFDSKDTPSAGGGGGGAAGAFAPNLSAPVSNTSTNLASIGFGEQAQEPVKVFVTETDISSSQKNVQKIEQKASIE